MTRKKDPSRKTPIAAAAKAVTARAPAPAPAPAPPVDTSKGVPYVAIPKELFDDIVAHLMTSDYAKVEPLLAPIRFGGAAREVMMVPTAARKG